MEGGELGPAGFPRQPGLGRGRPDVAEAIVVEKSVHGGPVDDLEERAQEPAVDGVAPHLAGAHGRVAALLDEDPREEPAASLRAVRIPTSSTGSPRAARSRSPTFTSTGGTKSSRGVPSRWASFSAAYETPIPLWGSARSNTAP